MCHSTRIVIAAAFALAFHPAAARAASLPFTGTLSIHLTSNDVFDATLSVQGGASLS
jgi:hypothetical protein